MMFTAQEVKATEVKSKNKEVVVISSLTVDSIALAMCDCES